MVSQKTADVPSASDRAEAEATSRALPGLALAFHFHSDEAGEELASDQLRVNHDDGWLWLHFDLSVPGASQTLDSIPDVPASAKTLLKTINDQQGLYVDDACTYGVFADFIGGLGGDAGDIQFVQFAMTERLFISSAASGLGTLDSLRGVAHKRRLPRPTELLKLMFDHVLDSVDEYVEGLAKKLDDIEETILNDQTGDGWQLIGQIRRDTVRLHRQITVGRWLIHRIERDDMTSEKLSLRPLAESASQRLDWSNSEIDALRERARLLQEEAMLKTADRTNSHLQVLAIVATVFLPATLIAGIFGMNVKGLPLTANGNGFFWSVLLIVGASAIIFWLLKWSGILGK